jgi:predicted transcriptional regulator
MGGQARSFQEVESNRQQLQVVKQQNRTIYNDTMSQFALQEAKLKSLEHFNQRQLVIDRKFLENLDLIQIELNDLGQDLQTVNQNITTGVQIVQDQSEEVKKDLKQHITEENDLLLDGQTHIVSKIDTLEKSIKKEIKESKNQIIEHFSQEINAFRSEYVNNLYLILRAIQKVPNLTTKELIAALKKELNVSKGTIYKYFRQLQEKELVEANSLKLREGPGRPSKIYNLTKKAKELLKNVLKTIK